MFIIGYDRAIWKANYFGKVSDTEKVAMKSYDESLPPNMKSARNRKEVILEKINSLPQELKNKALIEFGLHEYYSRNEYKHNCMIRDIPHPEMVVDYNDEWVI